MFASRSSQIELYAGDAKADDALKVAWVVDSNDVQQSGAQSFKCDFADYQFKHAGSYFNLETRFAAAESDISSHNAAHAGDIATLQGQVAQEVIDRQSADTTLTNSIASEVAARTTRCDGIAADLAAQVAAQQADKAASDALIQAETQARNLAIQAETQARQADVATLTANFNNLLSNSDPAAIDSISELLSAYQQGDNTLLAAQQSLTTRIAALEAAVSALVDQSF